MLKISIENSWGKNQEAQLCTKWQFESPQGLLDTIQCSCFTVLAIGTEAKRRIFIDEKHITRRSVITLSKHFTLNRMSSKLKRFRQVIKALLYGRRL